MLKSLSQIIAVFVSIGAAALITYIVHLYSMRSSIDEKMSLEGFKISSILEKHNFPLFWVFPDIGSAFMTAYSKESPDKNTREICDMILFDLQTIMSEGVTSNKLLCKDIDKLTGRKASPFCGRLYVFLLDKYFRSLMANEMRAYTLSISIPQQHAAEEEASSVDKSFPLGLAGMDQWISEFRQIVKAVKFHNMVRPVYERDLQKYLASLKGTKRESVAQKSNYPAWIEQKLRDLSEIEKSVNRISSLKLSKDRYSIESRIPHRWSILALFVLITLLGIAAPLTIEGLGIVDNIGPLINIPVLFFALALVFASVILIFIDISPNDKIPDGSYDQSEKHNVLATIEDCVHSNRYVNCARLNDVSCQDGESLRELVTLSARLNRVMESVSTSFYKSIHENTVLTDCITSSGKVGKSIGALDIIASDDMTHLIKPGKIWVISNDSQLHYSSGEKILIPIDKADYEKFLEAIDEMRSSTMAKSIYSEYASIKEELLHEVISIRKGLSAK